jgi:predicted TPR repeat methyltransferase
VLARESVVKKASQFNDLKISIEQARTLAAAGRLVEAGRLLDDLARSAPQSAEVWFLKGAVAGAGSELDEAVRCLERALELDPSHVDARFNLAQAYMHKRQFKPAAHHFREAIRLRPGHVDALKNLGTACQNIGLVEEAIRCYREVLRLQPDSSSTRFVLGALGADPAPDRAPPDYVAGLFDRYAAEFDQRLVKNLEYRTPERLTAMIDRVMSDRTHLNVLDLGCGTGLIAPGLRPRAKMLTGVDLSSKMVELARTRGLYDELIVDEIGNFLETRSGFDLIAAADVMPYLGNLSVTFGRVRASLAARGVFAFSVEKADVGDPDYALAATTRYTHSAAYVRRLAGENGYNELAFEECALRKEGGRPVIGCLFALSAA